MKKKNWLQKKIWRLKFRKVKYVSVPHEGRCTDCDGGKEPIVECSVFGCPCDYDEQLKFRTFNNDFHWKFHRI